MKRIFPAVVVLCALAGSCGIVSRAPLPEREVSGRLPVPSNKIVVVGRVEVIPPVANSQQALASTRSEGMKNVFVLYAGGRLKDFGSAKPETYAGSFLTSLGKDFFLAVDRGPELYVSGGMFCTDFEPRVRADYQVLPTPLQIRLQSGDRAVYIGTIQIHRDNRNEVRSVLIRDDFEQARQLFHDRFGDLPLRKSLAVYASPSQ